MWTEPGLQTVWIFFPAPCLGLREREQSGNTGFGNPQAGAGGIGLNRGRIGWIVFDVGAWNMVVGENPM